MMTVMKRIIFPSLIALLLMSYGCQKDSEVDYYPATTLSLSTTSFSELDANYQAEVTSSRLDVTEVVFTLMDGTPLTTVPMVNGVGNVSIPATLLAIPSAGKTVIVKMIAVVNGNDVQSRATITLYSPFTLSLPSMLEEGTMKAKSIIFMESTSGATVSSVSLTRKVSSAGVPYVYPNTFDVEKDSVQIVPSDYMLGDTLFFVVTTTSGSLTAQKSFSLIITKNKFDAAKSLNLNYVSDSIFNLVDGTSIAMDSVEISDLVYQTLVPGTVGFKSLSAMSFVKISGYSFDGRDFTVAKTLYDAGIPVTSVASVATGDMYAFKVTRAVVSGGSPITFYGVLNVLGTHILINDGVETSSIDFEYVVKDLY
jgi:hypothetical protein